MGIYRVQWVIEIESESPEQAAREALSIMQDKESEALCFEVLGANSNEIIKRVDLMEGE